LEQDISTICIDPEKSRIIPAVPKQHPTLASFTFRDLFRSFQTFWVHFHTQAEPFLKPVVGKQQETD